LDGSLSQNGEVDWYDFSVEGSGDILLVRSVGTDFDPTLYTFDRAPLEGGGDPRPVGAFAGYGEGFIVVASLDADQDLSLAVSNQGAWAAAAAPYTLSIETLAPSAHAEDGDFPSTTETATAIDEAVSDWTGTLTAEDPENPDADVFSVDLAAGQVIVAVTYALTDDAETDTVLGLSGDALEDPIENDDTNGLFSQVTYEVPGDGAGTYFLTVEPWCDAEGASCTPGDYGLRVILIDP
jgi:hypothetical protein